KKENIKDRSSINPSKPNIKAIKKKTKMFIKKKEKEKKVIVLNLLVIPNIKKETKIVKYKELLKPTPVSKTDRK
ncbi:18666_t:CDS:1, partial [Gigaspora margarita]